MMATGPRYRVPFRRRREGKTNYRVRRALVLSGVLRFVVRVSLKHITVQVIESEAIGDKVLVSAHSSELAKKYGWLISSGNIPSAYLTGLLCGFRTLVNGIEKVILDIGLNIPSKGTRVFAALKGVIDAGVEVPYSEDILPDENRISGKHIEEYGSSLSPDPVIYKRVFSRYLLKGLSPEAISDQFYVVKEKITSSFEKKWKKQKE